MLCDGDDSRTVNQSTVDKLDNGKAQIKKTCHSYTVGARALATLWIHGYHLLVFLTILRNLAKPASASSLVGNDPIF